MQIPADRSPKTSWSGSAMSAQVLMSNKDSYVNIASTEQ